VVFLRGRHNCIYTVEFVVKKAKNNVSLHVRGIHFSHKIRILFHYPTCTMMMEQDIPMKMDRRDTLTDATASYDEEDDEEDAGEWFWIWA